MEYYNNVDLTKLNRKELLEHVERERQEWLAAGMSEDAIYRVHFGEENEKGRGGDYRVWLNERKLTRPDISTRRERLSLSTRLTPAAHG